MRENTTDKLIKHLFFFYIMLSQNQLAIKLSKLKTFETPNLKLEQYATDSNIAAEILHHAYMEGDIDGKIIADLAAGPGILGIGCLLMGAEKVFFVDKDETILTTLQENLDSLNIQKDKYEIVHSDVKEFTIAVDLVIQNPPFGTKEKHHDKLFLEQAFFLAPIIYTIHKATSLKFVQSICKDFGFKLREKMAFNFPLPKSHDFHKKKVKYIEVDCYKLVKN